MKNILAILLCLTLFSCSNSIKDVGKITLENGIGEEVSVSYLAEKSAIESIGVTSKDFFSIIKEASHQAKLSCKYMKTYIPDNVSVHCIGATLDVTFYFTASNAFGVPDGAINVCKFQGTTLLESRSF